MNETIEIRWHGRGGQGTVTAAKVFADACMSGGRYIQAFPEYGPERSGAPLLAYNRISTKELRKHYPVRNPGVVVIVDATLIEGVDVSAGVPDDAVFLINAARNMDNIKKKLHLKPGQKLYAVDGSRIAQECIGRPLPNSPMVGALAKITGLAGLEVVVKNVEKSFGKKFSQKIVTGNLNAAETGWTEVCEI
ncbi:2-oxoacid:acceptor oxidoreductase family protein [Candidatus Parcubacteria bacterium]|nr:2-oxoacid:acceptor oxidoreductase family protein [Candidatus Parcubacteria bacterium]